MCWCGGMYGQSYSSVYQMSLLEEAVLAISNFENKKHLTCLMRAHIPQIVKERRKDKS